MNLSSFFIRTMLLLLPGIIGVIIFRKLVGRHQKKDWEDFVEVLIFSLLSYIIYGLIKSVTINISNINISNIAAFTDKNIPLNWNETIWAMLIGILLAIIASACYTYKIINKIGRFLKVTKRYGDEDIWDFFHNIPKVEWVVVRDHKVDLIYYGTIKAFSDSGTKRELLLENVEVYSNIGSEDNEVLYTLDALYISRDNYNLSIEIPNFNNEE